MQEDARRDRCNLLLEFHLFYFKKLKIVILALGGKTSIFFSLFILPKKLLFSEDFFRFIRGRPFRPRRNLKKSEENNNF